MYWIKNVGLGWETRVPHHWKQWKWEWHGRPRMRLHVWLGPLTILWR